MLLQGSQGNVSLPFQAVRALNWYLVSQGLCRAVGLENSGRPQPLSHWDQWALMPLHGENVAECYLILGTIGYSTVETVGLSSLEPLVMCFSTLQ